MTATAIPQATYSFDKLHSSANFAVKHMVVSTFRGRFDDVDASLEIADDGAIALTGTVKVASIDVRDETLAGHLASPDFFDAEKHPEIRYVSTSVRREADALIVDGEITVAGITKPVSARGTITEPTEDAFGGTRVGLALTTVVDRREFGLDWNRELPKGGWALGNDVELNVELEFVQES